MTNGEGNVSLGDDSEISVAFRPGRTNSPISFDRNIKSPTLRDSPKTPTLKINPIIGEINMQNSRRSTSISNILVKSFQPCLKRNGGSSESGEHFRDVQALLLKYRKEALLLSEIHMTSSEFCRVRNQWCTLCALIVALVCSVIDPILQKYADGVQKVFTTVSFAFIGGLNVVFNFLAFQQREEKHKQARDSYLLIVDSVEIALAYSAEEDSDKRYDFNKVLAEVRQIKTAITKNAPTIPPSISTKYESILCPSLLKYELNQEKGADIKK